ncbi:MAG: hypothetical protein ACE5H1_02585 [Thermodesulfobacteriota bacterium]
MSNKKPYRLIYELGTRNSLTPMGLKCTLSETWMFSNDHEGRPEMRFSTKEEAISWVKNSKIGIGKKRLSKDILKQITIIKDIGTVI